MNQNNLPSLIVPIHSPWKDMLQDAVKQVCSTLFFVSPYIKNEIIVMIKEALLIRRSASTSLHVRVVTRTLSEDFLNGSSDIVALQQLLEWPMDIPGSSVEIRAINNVHAKVWIFDTHLALVGSGNATPSGLASNLEYGLAVSDPLLVAQIQDDWQGWWEQAPEVTKRQLVEMQIWLNKTKNNEELLQIEADAKKKRQVVERKIGFSPFVGKVLRPILNKETPSILLSSEDNISLTDDSNITNSREHDQRPVVVSDPPWEEVLDFNTSSAIISQALLYHGREVSLNASGEVRSIGYPSFRTTIIPAHEDIIKLPAVPKEAVEVSGEHLWLALLATFPIVDAIRAKDMLKDELMFRGFLKIGCIQQKGALLLQCIWSDQNRISQVTFTRKRRATQSKWAIALNAQSTVEFMKRLNAALRDGWHASTNVHLLLETPLYQLLLFYSLHISFKTPDQDVGQIAIPCRPLDMADLSPLISSNSYFVTIPHKNLAEALQHLKDTSSSMGRPLSEVELHFNPPNMVTICLPGTSFSHSLPANQLTHFEAPLIVRFDYVSLAHILFYSSYGVHSWQISIGMNGKKVQFVPTMMSEEESLFKIQHELQNLVR